MPRPFDSTLLFESIAPGSSALLTGISSAMVSATAGDFPFDLDHLHTASLPLIDLRLLSQSELYSLSVCCSSSSSTSSASHSKNNNDDGDDVLIPKIDRSFFNESAGSRKQTYSRLRLSPRKPQFSASASATFFATQPQSPDLLDEESVKITSLFKQLFASESHAEENENEKEDSDGDDDLVTIHAECNSVPESSISGFHKVPIHMFDGGSQTKRKRGRPRKHDNRYVERIAVVVNESEGGKHMDEKDMEIMNEDGDMVNLAALGEVDEPFAEELKKRTGGMETEAELLRFLGRLHGEWVSSRKKRKIVPACDFGNALPRGWNLLLSLKRKRSLVWLACRGYISPNGVQFVSCKEVSSYLSSLLGLQDAGHRKSYHSEHALYVASSRNNADYNLDDEKSAEDLISDSGLHVTSSLPDHHKEAVSLKKLNAGETSKCDPCNIADGSVPPPPLEMQEDADRSTNIHEPISLPHDKQAIQTDKDDKCVVAEYNDKQCRDFNMTNTNWEKEEKVGATSIVRTVPSTDILKSFSAGTSSHILQDKGSDSSLVAPSINKKEAYGVENNVVGISVYSLDDMKLETSSGSGLFPLNGKQKTYQGDNSVEVKHLFEIAKDKKTEAVENNVVTTFIDSVEEVKLEIPSGSRLSPLNGEEKTVEDNKIDDGSKLGFDDSMSGISNNQTAFDSSVNVKEHHSTNNEGEFQTSTIGDSMQERNYFTAECSSSVDAQPSIVQDNVDQVNTGSISISMPIFDKVYISEENEVSTSLGGNNAPLSEKDVTNADPRSCNTISSSCQQPPCGMGINADWESSCTEGERRQRMSCEGSFFLLSDNDNNVNKFCLGTKDGPKPDEVDIWKINSPGNHESALHQNMIWREGNLDCCISMLPMKEHMFISHNHEVCNSSMEFNHDRSSPIVYLPSSSDVISNASSKVFSSSRNESNKRSIIESQNGDPSRTLSSSHAGAVGDTVTIPTEGRNSEAYSLICGDDQTYPTKNFISGVCSNTDNPSSEIGGLRTFSCPSNCEQTPSMEDIFNKIFGSGEQSRFDDVGNRESIGFKNHIHPGENSMGEYMLRTEQNVRSSDLAETSPPLMQSTGSFANLDQMLGKIENDFHSAYGSFSNLSGLQEMRTEEPGHFEYDFLTVPQSSSHWEEPKAMLYNRAMNQKNDSSIWHQKEALPLLPKIASGSHIRIVCIWCKKELNHEFIDPEIQAGSVGFMCASCQFKFSRNNHAL